LIALAGYFQASGISQLCGARLLSSKALEGAERAQKAAVLAGAEWHATSARPLLDRSPFDSQALRPLDGAPKTLTEMSVSECGGMSATLIASFPDAADWSVAAVTAKVGEKARLVRVGDPIGTKTVHLLDWNRVLLAEGDTVCEIETFRARAIEATLVDPGAAPPDDITKAIHKGGSNEARIERSAIDRVLANPFEFLKATRIVPEQQNGNVVGIRLFGISPGSLLGALGFENGDRLESVNGYEVGTPEQMMTAYAQLRAREHVTARVNRAGRILNLDVEVR
jgi:general secretion pathway protein C